LLLSFLTPHSFLKGFGTLRIERAGAFGLMTAFTPEQPAGVKIELLINDLLDNPRQQLVADRPQVRAAASAS
jgi:hypothetical protein